jgi:hypothetical protein
MCVSPQNNVSSQAKLKVAMSLTHDPREPEFLKKYQRMQKVGATPHIVYRVMSYDGFCGLPCMRMLLATFPRLTMGDAKEVMIEIDSGMSIDDYYEQLIPELEAALDQFDQEQEERNAPPS